jgi:hypothetical protein
MRSRRLPQDTTPNAWARLLAERRARGARLIDLTESNPTAVGLGGAGAAELRALAEPAGARYLPDPRGLAVAREAVAAALREDRRVAVDPEHVVLTASTSESYAHLFRLLADPGDAFLVPEPSYPLFAPLASLEGVRLEPYRLDYDRRWHLDRESLERAALAADGRARAAIVAQPNHPTGSCLEAYEVAALESCCERHGLAIVSDEVFGEHPQPPERGPLPTLLGSRRVTTFVLGGLSKTCGMPQLKLAWTVCLGPEPGRSEAQRQLEWIADLFLSVSAPVQLAAPRLLAARRAFRDRVRERLTTNLTALDALALRQPELERLHARGGWSAVLRLPRVRGEEEWTLALLERDVVVHPGHFYDFAAEGYLVLSLLPEPGAFSAGLERVAEVARGA